MIDFSKDSKGPFNFQAKDDQAPKKDVSQGREEEGSNLDWRQHTPSKNKPAAPDLALGGSKNNIRSEKEMQTEELTVILEPDELPMHWSRKIESDALSQDGYSFELTLKETDDCLALDNSDIDHLRLRRNGEKVAEFKDGWRELPATDRDWEEVERVKEMFTDTERKFYSIASDPDRGSDRDR